MKSAFIILGLSALIVAPSFAQGVTPSNPLIDYRGFVALAAQTEPVRAKRLLTLSQFEAKARASGAIVLDARSAQAFREGHIAGAVNLPLPDFNQQSLRRLIGNNPNRPILIYCNNNFTNDVRPVPTKSVWVALNVQTFVNLRAYGYENVWELGEAVDFTNPAVGWVS